MDQGQRTIDAKGVAAAAVGAAHYAAVRIGLGAKIIAAAFRRSLETTGMEDEVDIQLHRLGAMVYATHTGTPTDSEALLKQMKKVDAAMDRLREAEGEAAQIRLRCPNCSEEVEEDDEYCGVCGEKL